MSNNIFGDFAATGSWTDYRQARQLRELDTEVQALSSSLVRQREDNSRLRSHLAKMQGSLEERLTRMTRAFDAFVELSDIREILAIFDGPALVRHRSRELLTSLGQTDLPPALALPPEADLPDYWLAPAVRAVISLLTGADAEADIARAQSLDATKTAILIAVSAVLAGRRDLVGVWIGPALGSYDAGVPVTYAQRLLWQETANGTFGPEGEAALEARLRACLAPQRTSLEPVLVAKLGLLVAWPARIPLFDSDEALRAAVTAGAELAVLRGLCAPAAAGTDAPDRTALGTLVRWLVDGGTAEEQPLLRRAAELRAIIEGRPAGELIDWAAPDRTPEDLVVTDVFDTASGTSGVLARRVLSADLTALAAQRAAVADVGAPQAATIDLPHGKIRITATGASEHDVDALRATVERAYPLEVVVDTPIPFLAIAGVVVGIADVFLTGPLLVLGIFIAAGLLLGAAGRLATRRSKRADQADSRRRAIVDAERRITKSANDFAIGAAKIARVADAAVADRAAIEEALPGTA